MYSHTDTTNSSTIITEVDPDADTSSIPDCENPDFVSCQRATVNLDALLSGKDLDFFGKVTMARVATSPASFGSMVNFIYEVGIHLTYEYILKKYHNLFLILTTKELNWRTCM